MPWEGMEFQKLTGAGLLLSGGGDGRLAQALIISKKNNTAGGICPFFILNAP
jgi:hypothetical protein